MMNTLKGVSSEWDVEEFPRKISDVTNLLCDKKTPDVHREHVEPTASSDCLLSWNSEFDIKNEIVDSRFNSTNRSPIASLNEDNVCFSWFPSSSSLLSSALDSAGDLAFSATGLSENVSSCTSIGSRLYILKEIENITHHVLTSLSSWGPMRAGNRSNRRIALCNSVAQNRNDTNQITSLHLRLNTPEQTRAFAITMRLLATIQELLLENAISTIRDVYYTDVPLYRRQRTVDCWTNKIATFFQVPRHALHIVASSKSLIAGSVRLYDGNTISMDARAKAQLIPSMEYFSSPNIECDAKIILVIEKDAIFQRLIDDAFLEKHSNVIIVTGKGYPDVATRLFLSFIQKKYLDVKLVGLMDADPYGLHILSVYQNGSKKRKLPGLKMDWIGLCISECLSNTQLLPGMIDLSVGDRKKAYELLEKFVNQDESVYRLELEKMLFIGKKAELELLGESDFMSLGRVYLEQKLCQSN